MDSKSISSPPPDPLAEEQKVNEEVEGGGDASSSPPALVSCPFTGYGCDTKLPEKEMRSHVEGKDQNFSHMLKMMHLISTHERTVIALSEALQQRDDTIELQNTTISALVQRIEDMGKENANKDTAAKSEPQTDDKKSEITQSRPDAAEAAYDAEIIELDDVIHETLHGDDSNTRRVPGLATLEAVGTAVTRAISSTNTAATRAATRAVSGLRTGTGKAIGYLTSSATSLIDAIKLKRGATNASQTHQKGRTTQTPGKTVHVPDSDFGIAAFLRDYAAAIPPIGTSESKLLSNIPRLSIAGQGIGSFNIGVLGRLQRLRELDISNNKIETLPRSIAELPKTLTSLNISHNRLSEMPASIGMLTSLEKLLAFENSLRWLPAELGKLTRLTELHAHGNNIIDVPPELGRLSALRVLGLRSNHIMTLPDEICDLKRLERLDLGENKVCALPAKLKRLESLVVLNLRNNSLVIVPERLGDLSALRRLDIRGNPVLRGLPRSLAAMPALQILRVDAAVAERDATVQLIRQERKQCAVVSGE